MTTMQAIVLGVIQGLTEFLPVSSSGHLVFVPHLFGWADQGLSFDVVVHLGTLLAVVVYFRKTLWATARAFFGFKTKVDPEARNTQYRKLGWFLILATIPALIAGFLMSEVYEIEIRSTTVVAWGLIGWGIVLWLADRYSAKLKESDHRVHQTWKSALFIGCAQAIALIPGTSRSGITMTAGLFAKLNKKAAAEFSFLMSVPVIAIAGVFKLYQLTETGFGDISVAALAAGFVASALSGFLAIAGLMKVLERWSFMPFAVYRIVVGIAILVFLV